MPADHQTAPRPCECGHIYGVHSPTGSECHGLLFDGRTPCDCAGYRPATGERVDAEAAPPTRCVRCGKWLSDHFARYAYPETDQSQFLGADFCNATGSLDRYQRPSEQLPEAAPPRATTPEPICERCGHDAHFCQCLASSPRVDGPAGTPMSEERLAKIEWEYTDDTLRPGERGPFSHHFDTVHELLREVRRLRAADSENIRKWASEVVRQFHGFRFSDPRNQALEGLRAALRAAPSEVHRGCFCLHCNPPLEGEAGHVAPSPEIGALLTKYEEAAREHGAGKAHGLTMTLIRGEIERSLATLTARAAEAERLREAVTDYLAAWDAKRGDATSIWDARDALRAALRPSGSGDTRQQEQNQG